MRVYRSLEEIPTDMPPSAITIGKFDGVHAGHRAILRTMREVAAQEHLRSMVVTFDRNPLAVIAPEACPEAVVGLDQKIDLLEETGIDDCVVIPFDESVQKQSAEDFISDVLVSRLRARRIYAGEDFHFGFKGRGSLEMLREHADEYGYRVEAIGEVAPLGSRRVSSSWIREALGDGDVATAAALLGRAHRVRGRVVHGAKRGRALGFPTANLEAECTGFIPADGVYAGRVRVGDRWFSAAVSVGDNPTFEPTPQMQVEAYLLDQERDLYGKVIDVEFVERIRGMVTFEGIEPLIAQMKDDVARVREILG